MSEELVELKEIISAGGTGEAGGNAEAWEPEAAGGADGPSESAPPQEAGPESMEALKTEQAELSKEPAEEEVPLFVKVEKYEDMLSIIDEIKELEAKVSEVEEMEKRVQELLDRLASARSAIRAGMQARMKELDSMLVRPAGMRRRPRELREFDALLSELRTGLEEIRREVARLY